MSAPYPTQELAPGAGEKPPLADPAYPPQSGAPYPPAQPQGAYPPAQPQGAYPPAQPYPQAEQPPPYQTPQPGPYSAQQQNVVVVSQPGFVTTTPVNRQPKDIGLGIGGVAFGVFTTIFISSFACFWALPCSIAGIILGITSATAGESGNSDTAQKHGFISIGCSIAAWITAVLGVVVIVGAIVGSVQASVS